MLVSELSKLVKQLQKIKIKNAMVEIIGEPSGLGNG